MTRGQVERPRATIPDPAEQPTLSAEEAFRLLGCGRTSGYEMIRRDEFPVPVLHLGRVIRIPTAPLLEPLCRLGVARDAPGRERGSWAALASAAPTLPDRGPQEVRPQSAKRRETM